MKRQYGQGYVTKKSTTYKEVSKVLTNLMEWVEEVREEEDVCVRPEPECAAEALEQRPEEVPRVGEGERDQEQVEGVPHRAVVQDEARAEVAEHADDGEDGLHARQVRHLSQ